MTETITPPRAATRSDVDAVHRTLDTDASKPLAKVVEESGLDREVVREVLKHAQAGGVAHGLNGKWELTTEGKRRTAFRDGTVLGVGLAADGPVSLQQLADGAHSTWSQAYTSLARLRAAGRVQMERDGTRTVRYSLA